MVSKQEMRRNDPVVRAEVVKVLEERKATLTAMQPHVDALRNLVMSLPYRGVDDHFESEVTGVIFRLTSALSTALQYSDYTETYVGNMAIKDLGDRIVADLEKIEKLKAGI